MPLHSRPDAPRYSMRTRAARRGAWSVALLAVALALIVSSSAVAGVIGVGPAGVSSIFAVNSTTGSLANFTVADQLDRMLVVTVNGERAAGVQSVTYGTQNLIKAEESLSGLAEVASIWYLPNPAVGTASIDVTLNSGANNNGWRFGAMSFYHAAQTAPAQGATLAGSTGATAATSTLLLSAVQGGAIVEALNVNANAGNSVPAPASGQTAIYAFHTLTEGGFRGAASYESTPAAGAQSQTWTWTGSERFAHAGIVLAPSERILAVDFGATGHDVQSGFVSFQRADSPNIFANPSETYNSPLGNAGTVGVTLGPSVQFRDRAPALTDLWGNVGEDFVFTTADDLTLTLSGLKPGDYSLTAFFHDTSFTQATLDILVNGISQGFLIVPTTGSAAATQQSFLFTANGISDTVITFHDLSGTGSVPLLNGFILSAVVPEPSSLVLFSLGGAGLTMLAIRRKWNLKR